MSENSDSESKNSDSESNSTRKATTSGEAKFFFNNTLTGLVKALQGQYTTVDLRNESYVTGKISFVDAMMNIEMENVVFFDARGAEHIFPNFFISQRNIRYVHIPKKTSATQLIDQELLRMRPIKMKDAHTFKKVRSKRYNQEILQSAFVGETSSN